MDTPSIPSLSEMEDSNKPVPRIFVNSNSQCSEKFSNSESTDVKTSTSFIRKIMSNAKYMLTSRCNSLQPSIMSSEEPTRESDDCNRYGDYQGKVFRESSLINTKSRIKYTSSDYCMAEEESKADTTTMTSKENSDSRVLERERDSIGSTSQNSGDVTSSLRAFNEIVSDKDNFSNGTAEISPRNFRFPYADSESADFNGPFEQSEFFLRNDDTITNNIISTEGSIMFSKTTPVSQVTTGTSDMEKSSRTPFSLLNSWFRSDKDDSKKNDLDIPCRDECFCHTRSSSTSIPAIRRVSIGSALSQNQPCYGVGDPHNCEPCPSKERKSIASVSVSENDAEDELEELAPTCYSCGLKKQLVSTPSPSTSIGEGWRNGSDKVKTFHCESEVYPSRVLVCDDDSNPDCEDIGRYPEEIIPITGFKTSSLNVCSLRRIKSALSEKFPYSNRSIARSVDRKIPGDKIAEKRKSEHHFDSSPVAKRVRSISDSRDQDNQCAFVGSPVLDASNFRVPTASKKDSKGRTIGDMISDVNFREKNFRSQIQGFTNREKQYDNMRNSLQGEIAKCNFSHRGDKSNDDLERITRQLKNENNLLKSEMLEMKLDLKHTLEKVQGPMRLKLEAEKSRCEHLQKQLQKASQNMAVSEENYIRDMNNLKMQLCLACNNMDELESVNKKLKEEMNLMDGLCAKLEDDLMQQKLNEAETIRRLTTNKRSLGGDNPDAMMLCNCESNLHSIARKLSKTIKDCIPCPSCATGIPAELKGAARLIKDLTDMVDSRRDAMSFESIDEISRTDISCQSPPATEENSTQCMDLRNIGTVVSMCLISGPTLPSMSVGTSNRFPLSTNSLYVAPRELDRKESGQFNLKLASYSSETDQEIAMGKRSGTKSCHIKDSWTDPINIDPQIHLGRVRFEKHSPLVINTRDALNDPMMVDKNSSTTDKVICDINEAIPPTSGGKSVIEPIEQHLPPMSQKISFKVHTALIKAIPSDLKKNVEPDIRDLRPEIKDSRTEINDIEPVTAASKPEIQDIDVENEVFEPRIIAVDLGVNCDSKIDFSHKTSKMKILKRDPSEVTWQDDRSAKLLTDEIQLGMPVKSKSYLSEYSNPSIPKDLDNEDGQASKKRQKMSEFQKIIQLDVPFDTSNKKEPEPEQASSGESSRKVSDPNQNVVVENNDFPFLVDTKVEVCNDPPENLNITTSVTASGNLLVISEGPSGTIETILHYKDDGTIEVVTQIAELVGQSTDSLSSRKFYIPIPMKTDTIISEDISWEAGKKFTDQQEQEGSVSKHSQSTTLVSILSKESKKESVDKERTSKSVSISETASEFPIENRKNFSGNTASPLYIDRSQCCLICYQLDKASSAHHVPQVTASTSLSSTMINEKCGTSAVSKHNMLCGGSETSFIQQTVPLELQQKSAGEEVPKTTCSSLTCPILTSCKNEDTYDGANELRSDEEVSCASDVCHQETCTPKPPKKDAHTNPMAENKDEGSMCDAILIEKSSKESSASETLEFACQANLQPLEQSCQVNESKEIGVITAKIEKQSMTRENLFPDPPTSMPSDVPCSPCVNDSSKTDANCPSINMQPVGDAKIDMNDSAPDKTSESRDECACKKPCVCSPKKGPATEMPNEYDVKDKRKRSSIRSSECPCPGPCDCVKCSATVSRDDKKRKIGAVDGEESSFGSFKPQTKNAAEKQKQAQDRFGPYKTDFDVAYMDFMKPLPIAADKSFIHDVFKKHTLEGVPHRKCEKSHPIGCECVDCICMPLVRQLAMTREFCVVEDHKQVYQVTTNTCQCPNSKKGSKIPVATKSGKPVKLLACTCTGICTCSPCSDLEKRQGGGPKETGGKPTKQLTSEQLAELCDCGKCDCPICAKSKGSKKPCCCTNDCICDSCKIEMMKKQIDKLKTEVNELRGGPTELPDLGHPEGCDCGICNCPLPAGEDPRRDQPDDCDCIVCDCPLAPGKGGDMSGCTCVECYCPKGPKFQKAKVKKPIDLSGCICNPCKCPAGPLSAFPVCDCKICDCDPCSDPRRPKALACDCEPCECSPCGDTKKQRKKWIKTCECKHCKCSGLKDADCVCVTCLCGVHPPDCKCDQCLCKDKHPPGCSCAVCACGSKIAGEHPPNCTCEACKCGGHQKTSESGPKIDEDEKKRLAFLKKSISTHAIDCKCGGCQCASKAAGGALMCSCTPCKCVDCIFEKQKVVEHPPGCSCPKCKCRECNVADTCKCKDCKCKPCTHHAGKTKRADDCQCGDNCRCKDCGAGAGDKKAVKEAKSAPALPKTRSCHCLTCFCDSCNNAAKKGARSRPEIKIKGTERKTIAAGPSKQDLKKKPSSAPSGDSQKCKCGDCTCVECAFGGSNANPDCKCENCQCKPCQPTPPAATKKDAECHCATCTCKECAGKGSGGGGGGGFEAPTRISCQCKDCKCEICEKKGEKKEEKSKGPKKCPPSCPRGGGIGGGGVAPFEVPTRQPCQCADCKCTICNKKPNNSGGLVLRGGGFKSVPCNKDPPPFEVPSRLPCTCNPCRCVMCNKTGGRKESAMYACPVTTVAEVQVQYKSASTSSICPVCSSPSCTSLMNRSKDDQDGADCDCSLCLCHPCADTNITGSRVSTKVGDAVSTHSAKVGISLTKYNRSTSCICTPMKNAKVGESENRFGACESIEMNVLNLAEMDNATLMKNIADNTKENYYCKNQIQEITSALSNIKSVCSEVEEKAMKTPLIKQASAFGQTMSGLKLALNNLQEKCKAKDLLIEAMTGELRNRTNSNSFLQVLGSCVSGDAPDYDKAADIIPKNYEEKKFKAIEGERIVRKKRSSKICKCGKQHKDKDYKNVDLRGFEVVDIRRITDDSIILKWKPPKSGAITGYDIFINGVNKSKVMSGGRTSAMVHSIDLSATIQITIYAVTKCGRCEPPAIAIYEIRT